MVVVRLMVCMSMLVMIVFGVLRVFCIGFLVV